MAGHYDDSGQWIEDPMEGETPDAPGDPGPYYSAEPGPWAGGYNPYYPGGDGMPIDPPLSPPPPAAPGATPAPTPTITPTPTGNTNPFVPGQYHAPQLNDYPDLPNVPDAPTPDLPSWVTPAAYKAPTQDEAFNDPGYQFGLQQGNDSLQRWAAARGTLNDSGTAKALLDYGRNAATQQYAGVDARARDTYKTNYQTQYVDPYANAYKSALDVWTPKLDTWRAGVDMSRLGYTTSTDRIRQENQNRIDQAWREYQDEENRRRYNYDNPVGSQTYDYNTR